MKSDDIPIQTSPMFFKMGDSMPRLNFCGAHLAYVGKSNCPFALWSKPKHDTKRYRAQECLHDSPWCQSRSTKHTCDDTAC
jgi:hypothetical protein